MVFPRKLKIGMSLAPTWLSGEGWRRDDSGVEDLLTADFYIDIAKRAEAACLDFVFRPDTLFLTPDALETGPGFTSFDPTVLLSAVARETRHIGLLSTASTTFLPPYVLARQIQTLNWLSNGRAGWNVVTALEGQENFGLDTMPTPEERYARAQEFTEVVRALWESYPYDALRLDKVSGQFADANSVKPIDHRGPHFQVRGPLNLPSYRESRIPLVQAGASATGRAFAASVADAVFASCPDCNAAHELRAELRRLAALQGRDPEAVKLMPGLSLYLAESRVEAEALFRATHVRMTRPRRLAAVKKLIGVDLADWSDDRRVRLVDLPASEAPPRSRTHTDLLLRMIDRDEPLLGDLLCRPEVIGSGHWQVIGTVQDAFDAIVEWTEAGAIDGFITLPGGSVSSMHLALHSLMPKLADAGLLRSSYRGQTFLDHLTE